MAEEKWKLKEAIEYYKKQGAPGDQQALTALLKEVQEEKGGVLPKKSIEKIADAYDIKKSFLMAIIKRMPSLRTDDAPHRLEVCGGKACGKKDAAALAAYIEETYAVRDGGVSETGGFSYRVRGCMKKCGKGPAVKWDREIYTGADIALLRSLIEDE